MAKTTGIGDRFLIDGLDISGDVNSMGTISTSVAPLDVTGLPSTGHERLGGLLDGDMEWTSYFNPGVGLTHAKLSGLPTADVILTYLNGSAVGGAGAGLVAKQLDYNGSRKSDGSFLFKVKASADGDTVEWGEQLTAGVGTTMGAAGALASLDYGVSVGTTNFGLQAFLAVKSFTGTSATVAIQSSTDDGAGDAYSNVTGAVFAAVTTFPQAQRIETSRTLPIERYLRVNVTGTFSNFNFAVVVVRNYAAVLV